MGRSRTSRTGHLRMIKSMPSRRFKALAKQNNEPSKNIFCFSPETMPRLKMANIRLAKHIAESAFFLFVQAGLAQLSVKYTFNSKL
jgi:hypothetical protein